MSVRAVVERGVARLFVELRMSFGPSRAYSGQPLLSSVRTVESERECDVRCDVRVQYCRIAWRGYRAPGR